MTFSRVIRASGTCPSDPPHPKTKLYNREIGGLLKGSTATGCTNLTLIMMSGETGDLEIDGKTIHRVLATDWLLGRYTS